jgi:hypothetical protein
MPLHPVKPIQFGYIIFALLMFLLQVILVPRERIRKLFWFSLICRLLVDLCLVWIIRALQLYQYNYLEPFGFLGASILNSLAWSPSIILFIHFLPERKEGYAVPLYIGAFSMVGVFIGAYYTEFGLIQNIHFHYGWRFPIWYLWFSATYWHYRKLKAADPESI